MGLRGRYVVNTTTPPTPAKRARGTFSSGNTMLETEHDLAVGGQLIPNSSVPHSVGPDGNWLLPQLWEEEASRWLQGEDSRGGEGSLLGSHCL